MFTSVFWKGATERAIKTVVQAFVALVVANAADLLHADWKTGLVAAVMAGVASVGTSIVSSLKGDSTSPSLVGEKF